MQHIINKSLLLFSILFFVTGTACAASYEEGKHYKRVDMPKTIDGDKVEVLEFFWYGCPHCYSFEPHVSKWKSAKPDNVEFVRIPATFQPLWVLHARAYYALEMLGVGEKIHPKFFAEVHTRKNYMKTVDALTKFVEQHGVNRSEFIDAMNSFTVETKVRKATKLVNDYKLSGVPSVTINGKYLISASMAGSYDNMIKIMNYLIEKETAKAAVGAKNDNHS
ncbi:MAG: thiol:disulfide interchange protein DsbA/DsbL [Thiotrichales bacterium]|nr:MAG: thiol:disulfide interchange protein DsbA/DsbL [Thiotrichales bacterium]